MDNMFSASNGHFFSRRHLLSLRKYFFTQHTSAAGIVMLGLLLSSCSSNKGQASGRQGGGAVAVEAIIVKAQPLENKIFATGTLLANEEVELRPEISGRIVGVYFDEGRRVNKGALMLKINDRELRAELKRKELEEKLAADEERRRKGLYDIKGISQEEYERSLNELRVIQAEKEVIESQIAETEIRAPFDGVVGLRHVSEGGYASPNMLAATMQDIDPMKVEFSVPEKYARQLKSGNQVTVELGEGDVQYRGTIYAIESKIDPGTRTIKTRARIPNPDEKLMPGSFAKVEIVLEQISDAVVVPAGAIIPELSGEKVYVVNDAKAKAVTVKTGVRTELGIQITDGLNADDTLIVTGLLQIGDGRPVNVQMREN